MTDELQKQRIKTELIAAGISKHALRKNEVSYLPNVIHPDEHIGAAINGRAEVGSVMLVATDKRVIFLDCKSFYTTTDELTYDVVSGVVCHIQGLFANVVLHTRIGDYNLRFVNVKQAKHFTAFIEKKRLENVDSRTNTYATNEELMGEPKIDEAILDKQKKLFLQTHYLGVLSTLDRTGNVHGSAVYYVFDGSRVYILTKSETEKARNILVHKSVAFTIFEEVSYEILQAKGVANIVTDSAAKMKIFQHITSIRNIADQKTLPPVTKIKDGSYVVIEIVLTEVKYTKYK